MTNATALDQGFGAIAVASHMLTQEKLDRAQVVQRCIFMRSKVHMHISKILKEMGLLDQAQIDLIMELQQAAPEESAPTGVEQTATIDVPQPEAAAGMILTIDKDKMAAYLELTSKAAAGVKAEAVHALLARHGVLYGVVSDDILSDYLGQTPLPSDPLQVAVGTPVVNGQAAEVRYYFDIDPQRVGTVKEDGSIDWRDRGQIPQVKEGDLLAEKCSGDPGVAGITVLGTEIPPARAREAQLKCGRGAQRSEDGRQVTAKIAGTPKLGGDGRISVFSLLPIEGDIGLETGHIDFDGFIETDGGVASGFNVKARGLRTKEIQDARIEIIEELLCPGGIYRSTLEVGGDLKAGHIHNCVIRVGGDIVVEREILECTIETSGRCIVSDGKIIASKIDAKKGVIAKSVGTAASNPTELIVGIDRGYQRGMTECKASLQELEPRAKEIEAAVTTLRTLLADAETAQAAITHEQAQYLKQKHQFEAKLDDPETIEDEEECLLLNDLIAELDQALIQIAPRVIALTQKRDRLRMQLDDTESYQSEINEKIKELNDRMVTLEDALRNDPGVPVVKVSGTIYANSVVSGLRKSKTLPENRQRVHIAETKADTGGRWIIKISDLR